MPKSKQVKNPAQAPRKRQQADFSKQGVAGPHVRNSNAALNGMRIGFPANRTVTLDYCDTYQSLNVAGVIRIDQFRLNGAFDPDYTGVGHQPMGFDEWALFYNHYVVTKCEYAATPVEVTSLPMMYGAHISDDAVVPAIARTLMEEGSSTVTHAIGTPLPTLEGTIHMDKFFNRDAIGSDPELRAGVGAVPTEECILSLWGQPVDVVSAATVRWCVRLRYTVRFMEPKDLAPSAMAAAPSMRKAGVGNSSTKQQTAALSKDSQGAALADGEDAHVYDYVRVPRAAITAPSLEKVLPPDVRR